MPKNHLIKFLIFLSTSLLIVFILHIGFNYLRTKSLFPNRIIESYLVNALMAYISFIILFFSTKKYVSSLGFIFMIISIGKFLIFYILFKPHYSLNQNVDLEEFLTIMIPYSISLFTEIYALSKILKD